MAAGERDALLLAAGQLARAGASREAVELDHRQRLLGAPAPISAAGTPAHTAAERRHSRRTVMMREEGVVLEDEADVAAAPDRHTFDWSAPIDQDAPALARLARGRRASIAAVVVLPEPDGPSMVRNSPHRTARFRSSTTSVRPS
jgi:hypothetical protein